MGAVSYLNMHAVRNVSNVFKKLSKYYYAGHFDLLGGGYALKKASHGAIRLELLRVGDYYRDETDEIADMVKDGTFNGVINLWGRTPGRGYSTDDLDPWNYLYLDLCFVENELVAVILDNHVVWSPYPLHVIKDKIKDICHDLSSYSTEPDLMDLLDVKKHCGFRERAVEKEPNLGPAFAYTEPVAKEYSDFITGWAGKILTT